MSPLPKSVEAKAIEVTSSANSVLFPKVSRGVTQHSWSLLTEKSLACLLEVRHLPLVSKA